MGAQTPLRSHPAINKAKIAQIPTQLAPTPLNAEVVEFPHGLLDFCTADGFVSLFQVGREHIFDPFHECADAARQIAPMCYDEGHGERPATKIG